MDDIEARIDLGWVSRAAGSPCAEAPRQAAVAAGIVTVAMVAGSEYLGGAPTSAPRAWAGIAIIFGPVLAVEEFAADLDQAFARGSPTVPRFAADPANPVPLTLGDIVISDVTFAYLI